jgi:hypothetical protein
MAEMNEKGNGVAAGTQDAGRGADAAGEEEAELRAEEDSAKAMEAEVPHSTGYDDPAQEPPADSGQGSSS